MMAHSQNDPFPSTESHLLHLLRSSSSLFPLHPPLKFTFDRLTLTPTTGQSTLSLHIAITSAMKCFRIPRTLTMCSPSSGALGPRFLGK